MRVVANANKSRRKRRRYASEDARARGNRALPSTRLTFPMIMIGSTTKSEGINYPCGFPIQPLPLIRAGLNEDESRGIPSVQVQENGAHFLAEETHEVILMYYSRKKRVTIVPSRFSRSVFPALSILQYPHKLRYEFSGVTRNINVRYGSRSGYLRGRFPNISSRSFVTDILCGMGHTVTSLRTRETS